MKFEGPAPDTETRQVSMSFAAFIVAVAFVLFGIAMAVGTTTANHTTEAPQPETVSAEQASSENVPPSQPAVTQPVADPSGNADTPDDGANQADSQQTAQEPDLQVASVAESSKAANPPANIPSSEPAVTHDPSFPSRHAATPPLAAATAPVIPAAPSVKR